MRAASTRRVRAGLIGLATVLICAVALPMVAGALGLGSASSCLPIGTRSAVGNNSPIAHCCPLTGGRGPLGNNSPVGKCPTTLTTTLTGVTAYGARVPFFEVFAGTPVTDTAVLSGANASVAGGTVTYSVYAEFNQTHYVADGGTFAVANGVVPASAPLTLPAGTYFWQATYSGDALNAPSASKVGSEREVVVVNRKPPPT